MIKNEIVELQKQLNNYLSTDTDYSIVYDLSLQLDKLIIDFYKSKDGTLIN